MSVAREVIFNVYLRCLAENETEGEFTCLEHFYNRGNQIMDAETQCGNQRDLARAKNQKKQSEQSKKKANEKTGMTLEQRKHRDAELMREKQKKKEEEAAGNSGQKA